MEQVRVALFVLQRKREAEGDWEISVPKRRRIGEQGMTPGILTLGPYDRAIELMTSNLPTVPVEHFLPMAREGTTHTNVLAPGTIFEFSNDTLVMRRTGDTGMVTMTQHAFDFARSVAWYDEEHGILLFVVGRTRLYFLGIPHEGVERIRGWFRGQQWREKVAVPISARLWV